MNLSHNDLVLIGKTISADRARELGLTIILGVPLSPPPGQDDMHLLETVDIIFPHVTLPDPIVLE